VEAGIDAAFQTIAVFPRGVEQALMPAVLACHMTGFSR
jgi:hypothetical protein